MNIMQSWKNMSTLKACSRHCVCVCVCVCRPLIQTKPWISWTPISCKGYKGYKDGLQPETLADGNWLVKQNQPVSKIETKSDTNLRSLYESWFRNALISKSVILWWQVKKGINSEFEGANTRRRVLNIPSKRSLYLMRSSHTSAHLQKKSTCFSSWTSPHSYLSQMLEPPCHLQDSTLKWCARNLNLLKFLNTCPNPCTSRRG